MGSKVPLITLPLRKKTTLDMIFNVTNSNGFAQYWLCIVSPTLNGYGLDALPKN